MQLLISDANILIDLEEGRLIDELFKLPFEFGIPDILFTEELEDEHRPLIGMGLQLKELSADTMEFALTLTAKYTKASRNDCFALALATQENCPLLTGDRALRDAAETESVVVNGTLWLVDLMVRQGLIDIVRARESYEAMKDAGRRLPWAVAEAKLNELAVDSDK